MASVAARRGVEAVSFDAPARAGSSSAGSPSVSSSCSPNDGDRPARPPGSDALAELPFGRDSRSSSACSRFRDRGTTRVCSATASGSASSRRCGSFRTASTRERFKTALARESQYFNAHPYLASVAVGALARAELDGEPPATHRAISHGVVRPARQRRRPAGVGGVASVLLACVARHLWTGRERACGRRILSARLQRGTPRPARVGAAHGLEARAARGVGARQPGAAPRTASRSDAWPRSPRVSRFRCRSAGSSAPGEICSATCWSPSRSARSSSFA